MPLGPIIVNKEDGGDKASCTFLPSKTIVSLSLIVLNPEIIYTKNLINKLDIID